MTALQEMVFIGEIVLQSKIAKRAGTRLQAASDNFDYVEVWMSLQSILVAAGNVSKILWPVKEHEVRGNRLRQLLKVDDSNPLKSRKFRNHFEHYDERIATWFKDHSSTVYSDLAMNPTLHGRMRSNHRGYNSFNNTLQFRDDVLHLNEILKALEVIQDNCRPYVLI